MEAFKKKKGKEGARGAKQIVKENAETVAFYRNMILGANGVYFAGMTLLGAQYGPVEIGCFLVCLVVYTACYQFMARLGSPRYAAGPPEGLGGGERQLPVLLDPGLDLNMESGMAEHVKDIVILTAAVQAAALISNYAWFLLLLAPLRAAWMGWKNVVSPWVFSSGGAGPDGIVDQNREDKKQKKLERKMKRYQR